MLCYISLLDSSRNSSRAQRPVRARQDDPKIQGDPRACEHVPYESAVGLCEARDDCTEEVHIEVTPARDRDLGVISLRSELDLASLPLEVEVFK